MRRRINNRSNPKQRKIRENTAQNMTVCPNCGYAFVVGYGTDTV